MSSNRFARTYLPITVCPPNVSFVRLCQLLLLQKCIEWLKRSVLKERSVTTSCGHRSHMYIGLLCTILVVHIRGVHSISHSKLKQSTIFTVLFSLHRSSDDSCCDHYLSCEVSCQLGAPSFRFLFLRSSSWLGPLFRSRLRGRSDLG